MGLSCNSTARRKSAFVARRKSAARTAAGSHARHVACKDAEKVQLAISAAENLVNEGSAGAPKPRNLSRTLTTVSGLS